MRYIIKTLLVTLICTLSSPVSWAANEDLDELQTKIGKDWTAVKNDQRHGFKTFAKQEDGKRYRSFKIEATLEASTEALARVLLDFDNYTRWFWKTRESKLLRQESPTEFLIYMVHDAPYGLPDRDTVLRANVEPQAKNKPFLTLRVTAVPDALPANPPLVRMIAEDMMIRFMPIGNNRIEMTTEGYFDPGGVVPAWAANFVQKSAPYTVVVALQRMAQRPEYNNKTKQLLPFPVFDAHNLP